MARVNVHSVEAWRKLAYASRYKAASLARLVAMHPRTLNRHIHDTFGRSPQQWLDDERLELAADQLRQIQCVKVVSSNLSFSSAAHFSRRFKERYALCPSAFLREAAPPKPPSSGALIGPAASFAPAPEAWEI